jgi:16S rRNA (cytidine1402-2'-O)-methyltransferase
MLKGKLIVGSMPIGNIQDYTLRLIRWLDECDLLVIENENTTIPLFEKSNIVYNKNYIEINHDEGNSRLIKDKNLNRAIDIILQYLESGKNVLFISDEGTPGINDPGKELIYEIKSKGYDLEVLAGPSIVTTAFVHAFAMDKDISGYGFTFLQPHSTIEVISKSIQNLKNLNTVIIFTIEPMFIDLDVPSLLLNILGNRKVLICQNMTMDVEEIIKTDLQNLKNFVENDAYITIAVYPY